MLLQNGQVWSWISTCRLLRFALVGNLSRSNLQTILDSVTHKLYTSVFSTILDISFVLKNWNQSNLPPLIWHFLDLKISLKSLVRQMKPCSPIHFQTSIGIPSGTNSFTLIHPFNGLFNLSNANSMVIIQISFPLFSF